MTVELVDKWPKEMVSAVGKVVTALDSYQEIDLPEGAVNIMLVSDEEITDLNTQYSGNAYATDVLTFAYPEEGEEDSVDDGELADVVISTETAARQAEEAGIKLEEEVALLALHGILHAIGLDHHQEDERAYIDQLQEEILGLAGMSYRDFKWVH